MNLIELMKDDDPYLKSVLEKKIWLHLILEPRLIVI